MNDIATSEDNAPKKPKRASRASAAVLREPWKPTDAEERRQWEEREAAEARQAAEAEPPLSRAEARAINIAKLREQAEAEGTLKDLFPTSTPVDFAYKPASLVPVDEDDEPDGGGEVPVLEGDLASLAHEINARLSTVARMEINAENHRLSAALQLAEAKKLCETKRISFKKWCEAHVAHAYVTVRKLARIGSSENPRLALEMDREKNAEANKDLRRRKKAEMQALIAANPEVAAEIAQARPVVEPVREGGRFVGSVSLSPVEAMLREFDRLEQEAKAEFLKKAAEHMGVTVELPE